MDGDNDSRVDDGRPTLGTEQCVPNQEASTLKKLFQRIAELGRRDMAGCPHAYLSFALRTNDLQPHPRLGCGQLGLLAGTAFDWPHSSGVGSVWRSGSLSLVGRAVPYITATGD